MAEVKRTTFEACLSDDQLRESEAIACNPDSRFNVTRRIAMTLCARNFDELKDMTGDLESFDDVLGAVEEFRGRCEALLEIADAALARMAVINEAANPPSANAGPAATC